MYASPGRAATRARPSSRSSATTAGSGRVRGRPEPRPAFRGRSSSARTAASSSRPRARRTRRAARSASSAASPAPTGVITRPRDRATARPARATGQPVKNRRCGGHAAQPGPPRSRASSDNGPSRVSDDNGNHDSEPTTTAITATTTDLIAPGVASASHGECPGSRSALRGGHARCVTLTFAEQRAARPGAGAQGLAMAP